MIRNHTRGQKWCQRGAGNRWPFISCAMIAVAILVGQAYARDPTTAPAETSSADDATQIRVRELIYVLRHHRVFERMDEWGAAIRELVTIGEQAVPEILLELKQTRRQATMRGLLFALRAINDPRALPFVMDELGKAEQLSKSGSDCGVYFLDPELHAFMRQHQKHPDNESDHVAYGRPINEIIATLHKLTGTTPPDLTKGLGKTWHSAFWREWWTAQQSSGDARQKEQELQLTRTEDLVERDGVRKFGLLFPTGNDQRLGPVAKFQLASIVIADAPSSIDLETGCIYEYLEGMHYASGQMPDRLDIPRWRKQNGIDLSATDGHDIFLWKIKNDRWDSLESEVKSEKPLELGAEANFIWQFPEGDETGTFLFTTREGARGVLRDHRTPNGNSWSFEYRLWNRDAIEVASRSPLPPVGPGEWQPEKIVILKEPAFGNRCLYDFETDQAKVLPKSIFVGALPDMAELLRKKSSILNDERIKNWAQKNGIDVAAHRSKLLFEGEPPKGALRPDQIGQLTILDAREVRVSAEAFNDLTLTRAREILARTSEPWRLAYLTPPFAEDKSDLPATYLIQTKSGWIGLVAIINFRDDISSISFRYKLAKSAD